MRHCLPVDAYGRGRGAGIFLHNLVVQFLSIGPLLARESNARQPEGQGRGELIFGQIALDAVPFFSVFVEDQDRRRPQDVKAMEAGRILFDVNFNGGKGLVDP